MLSNIFIKAHPENVDKLYEKIDLFSEVLEKIQNEYVDEIDQADVIDSAINGVLQSLDPYSAYMNPKIFEESQTETSGEFGGLGIEVTMESGVVKVISPIDNTPGLDHQALRAHGLIGKYTNVFLELEGLQGAEEDEVILRVIDMKRTPE